MQANQRGGHGQVEQVAGVLPSYPPPSTFARQSSMPLPEPNRDHGGQGKPQTMPVVATNFS
eukprot:2775635-Pyramimonas_sp.AAC.1